MVIALLYNIYTKYASSNLVRVYKVILYYNITLLKKKYLV